MERKQRKSAEFGTIWKLGDHRLAFGDCRDGKLISKLLGSKKIDLIVTDPPYGVAAVESKRNFKTLAKNKAVANDQLQSEEQYKEFTKSWLSVLTPNLARQNTCYIFNADKMVFALKDGMAESGFKVSQLLLWIKSQAVLGRLDYAPQHELIVYGWNGTHAFRRSKDKTVFFYPRPAKNPMHPTTKPIGLIRRLILNSSRIGDAVFDGFVGSGTTLLACEQTKRRCFAIESDLEYCMTVIRRFEKLTGKKVRAI